MTKTGKHIRHRTWNWTRLHLSLQTLTAICAGTVVIAVCLAMVTDLRQDLAEERHARAAVEARQERATQDVEDLWDIVIALQSHPQGQQTTVPGPSVTQFEAPDLERLLPRSNRSQPRLPSPAPSWHPVPGGTTLLPPAPTPGSNGAVSAIEAVPEPQAQTSTAPSPTPSPSPEPKPDRKKKPKCQAACCPPSGAAVSA